VQRKLIAAVLDRWMSRHHCAMLREQGILAGDRAL
jgi:hypothetical protein